jgi:signal peptide peptidase SppA
VVRGVAVIPIVGTLIRRGSFTGQSSGTTSYEGISAQLRAAAEDDAVRVIALEIDSFGGEAAGIFDLGETIRQVREVKPVRAFIADYALSAGYAIASQADHITIPPFGEAGSIGVVLMHVDYEQYLEQEGIKVSLIHSGAHKVEGNPFEALPEAVRDRLQAEGDAIWQSFAEMVSVGRRGMISTQAALDTEARTFRGDQAVAAGLADEVAEARVAFAALLDEVSPQIQPVGARAAQAPKLAIRGPSGTVPKTVSTESTSPCAGLAARMDTPAEPASAAKETPMDWESLTTAQLREHRADLVSEIETEATSAATAEKDKAVKAAVTEERARIAAIDEIAMEAHADLVAAAKADGRSAEQLALDIVKADKAAGGNHLKILRSADAAAGVPAAPSSEPVVSGKHEGGTPEEQAEAAWDSDANLRAEFKGKKEDYLAYAKAESAGRARTLRRAS